MIKRPASLRSDVDSHPTGILIRITGIATQGTKVIANVPPEVLTYTVLGSCRLIARIRIDVSGIPEFTSSQLAPASMLLNTPARPSPHIPWLGSAGRSPRRRQCPADRNSRCSACSPIRALKHCLAGSRVKHARILRINRQGMDRPVVRPKRCPDARFRPSCSRSHCGPL
jgi:hypothetical protein